MAQDLPGVFQDAERGSTIPAVAYRFVLLDFSMVLMGKWYLETTYEKQADFVSLPKRHSRAFPPRKQSLAPALTLPY